MPSSTRASSTIADAALGRWRLLRVTGGRLGRRRSLVVGVALLGIVIALCLVVPPLSPYSPDAFVAAPYLSPSWSHPFGTDTYGRDLLVRVFVAGRLDLVVAAVGVAVPLVVGTLIGTLVGGASRRWPDVVVMRIVDAIVAFPFVILVLTLVVVFGVDRTLGPLPAGLPSLFIAVFLTSWALYARLARAQTLALKNREFIAAARLLGFSHARIVRRHLLPTVFKTTATYAVSDAILLIIVTASLPFLGAGVQPPTPEWGAIMYEGRTVIETSWWITVCPGIALAITGLGASLIADALVAGEER